MLQRKVVSVVTGLSLLAVPAMVLGEASITGKVLLDGKAPRAKAINMGADPKCKAMRKGKDLEDETFIVGKDGELANVFVSISKGLPDKKWEVPKEPVKLSQEGCQYKPHVFGMMAGQPLEIVNDDATNHNVHSLPKENKEFNFAQPNKGMTKTLDDIDKPETFKIKCDVHAWMGTYAHVMEHPFFAVTGEDGTFKIDIADLPAGEYELTYWHESGAEETATIKVEAGKENKADDMKLEPKKSRRRR